MRRNAIWLSVLAMAVFAGNAMAIPSAVPDGNWNDWFTGYGGSPGSSEWQEGAAYGGRTHPEIRSNFTTNVADVIIFGGQKYDVEQIFYFVNSNTSTLHVALVTGFPPAGVPAEGIFGGDLFLGYGNSGSLTTAIGVATDAGSAGRFEQAYSSTTAADFLPPNVNPAIPASAPWRMDETSGTVTNVTGLLNPQVAWGGNALHHFMEVTIALSVTDLELLTHDTNGGLSLHWTMQCGNDEVDVNDSTPFAPIPEPATMVLLGMGVLGIALRARRPQC